ncbi:MAG: 16S rRNA (guanine(527)-N(7))-methyltransferase [Rubrivivax sp. SCN 70-15]|nr:MAG: 16S rRNA (guanine(527)-N(7))-methyltransferase [Rubrivivax sp. SCN 70-15]
MTGAIDAVCRELGLSPEPAQTAALAKYLALLQRWNATHNLTAIREPAAMLTQHLADCLAVIPPLHRHMAQGRLLDVGSGGGLPGVVIAVMLPAVEVVCVDAVGKKAAFIRQAAGVLGLRNLRAVHARVEDLREAPFEVITSRAFASLADFVALTRRHLGADGVWLAMKGREPADEIAALPADTEVFHVEPLRVPGLDAQRCLIWMRPRRNP